MSDLANSDRAFVALDGDAWRAPSGTPLPALDPLGALPVAFKPFGGIKAGLTITPTTDKAQFSIWNKRGVYLSVVRNEVKAITFIAVDESLATVQTLLRGGQIATTAASTSATLGTAILTASTDEVTVSAAHGLVVGDKIVFGAITGGVGLTAGTTYYVTTVVNTTKVKVSATAGGTAIDITTDGTSVSVSKSVDAFYSWQDRTDVVDEFAFVMSVRYGAKHIRFWWDHVELANSSTEVYDGQDLVGHEFSLDVFGGGSETEYRKVSNFNPTSP